MTDVIISTEARRGCGYRKPSAGGVGIYLMGPALNAPCGRMPFELKSCRTCGEGIKPRRGWGWIEPRALFGPAPEHPISYGLGAECAHYPDLCRGCPMGLAIPEGRHGLIWIGEAHYPTPEDFLLEAQRMGLSRKIGALPKGFKLGETVVYLAHRKAVSVAVRVGVGQTLHFSSDGSTEPVLVNEDGTREKPEPSFRPGIFATFKPTGVDLVIADENAVPEKATKLAEKIGDKARIVRVVPKEGEQVSLPIVQEASP